MYVVLYNSGAAGDLVAALIDETDYFLPKRFPVAQIYTKVSSIRKKFQEIHQTPLTLSHDVYESDEFKTLISEVESRYKAITSHWFDSPLFYNYDKIIIDDTDDPWYKVTCDRYNKLIVEKGYPTVTAYQLNERRKKLISYMELYNESMIIKFQDIVEGRLLEVLGQWFDIKNPSLYHQWLERYNNTKVHS